MNSEILTASDTLCVRPFPVQHDAIRARLADVARQEEKRRQLLNILKRTTSPWNPSDHPELDAEHGAAGWVKKLRSEWEKRFQKRTRAKEQG
jgi:hypothetical protein